MGENGIVQNQVTDDTVKLLRECDAGIKMGIESLNQVSEYVKDCKLKEMLQKSSDKHESLQDEATTMLHEYGDDGKNPNPVAKGMSWLKTNMKMTMDSSDKTVADLMVDGCNMGTKSLHKYLNQYSHATEKAKQLVKEVLKEEEGLAEGLRAYL